MTQSDDLTERTYHLRCKTKFFKKSVHENIRGIDKHYERTMVLLVPQESDERTKFLTAWLPETEGEYYEVSAFISMPVDSPARLSVHRRDQKCTTHYLFVMSKGVEDILLKFKEGTTINVQINPASQDAEADFAKDAEHNFEVMQ